MNLLPRRFNVLLSLLSLLLLCGIAFVASGCSSAIDRIVDDKVATMLEQENKKLPADVGQGIQLIEMRYDADRNKLTMIYQVPDQRMLTEGFEQIKTETSQRVKSNEALTRALDNGIEVHHEFHTGEIKQGGKLGRPAKSFVTR